MRNLALFLVLFSNIALAHRYHQSSLFLKLAVEENYIQAVLEIDSGDFQSVLRRQPALGEDFLLEDLQEDEAAMEGARAFIESHLQFTLEGERFGLVWHGVEIGRKLTKVYLKVVSLDSEQPLTTLSGFRILNTLLYDWNDNQLNYIFIEGTSKFYRTSRIHGTDTVVID